MINIFVVDSELRKLDAVVYVANNDTKEILLNRRCRNGEIYKPEFPEYIKSGNHTIRVRCCTVTYCWTPVDFQLYRDNETDIELCVKMELDW